VKEATETPSKILESTSRNTNRYTTEAPYKTKVERFLRYQKRKYKLKDEWHHTNETAHAYQHSAWSQHPK